MKNVYFFSFVFHDDFFTEYLVTKNLSLTSVCLWCLQTPVYFFHMYFIYFCSVSFIHFCCDFVFESSVVPYPFAFLISRTNVHERLFVVIFCSFFLKLEVIILTNGFSIFNRNSFKTNLSTWI